MEWVEFLKGNKEAMKRALVVAQVANGVKTGEEEKCKVIIEEVNKYFDRLTVQPVGE